MKYIALRGPRHRGRTAAFTLVEMLAVVGIILILTTLTVYSIRGDSGATNRHAAVSALMSVLDQARMLAVSDGRATYVVFVSEPPGQKQNVSTFPDTMWGRAYALFEDPILKDTSTAAGTTNLNSFNPMQLSSWLYLPTGVAFKANTYDGTTASVTDTARLVSNPDQTAFNVRSRSDGTVSSMILPYIKFDPTGQIVDYNGDIVDASSPTLRIHLFEGIASNQSNETFTHTAAISSKNGKKFALDEILLKSTTGRAEYTLNPSNNLAAVTTSSP